MTGGPRCACSVSLAELEGFFQQQEQAADLGDDDGHGQADQGRGQHRVSACKGQQLFVIHSGHGSIKRAPIVAQAGRGPSLPLPQVRQAGGLPPAL
ncbi:hypothetical protein, partial [Escherichia coli]|uniref:hypothetical protein n=1 Tax=Escherichia coli TaxID=562 RepID=UPI001BC8A7F7